MRDFPALVHLAPAVSHPDDAMDQVIDIFARDQGAGAVFVVDDDDHLLGCIAEDALDRDLVTLVLPEHLWSAVRELDTRSILRAARHQVRHASDLMVSTRAVRPDTPLEEALIVMAHAPRPIAPLVDEHGRLLGYLRLFEVLAHLLRQPV